MKLKLKVFRQTKEGYCGPDSIKTVLDYYGLNKSEREIAKAVCVTKKEGCTPQQIISGMKKFGLNAYYKKDSTLKQIKDLLKKNIPPMIYWGRHGEGHYSVITGIGKNNVWIADPENKKVINLKMKYFLRRWIDVEKSKDKREIIVIEH